MVVFLTNGETENEVILQWHSTEVGDVVENPAGVGFEHPTLLAVGTAKLEIAGMAPQEFEAPHIIVLPVNTPYKFTVIVPGTIYCVYNKLSGSADEIRQLVSDVTAVYQGKAESP